jgi:DNA-binding NarL/FixJ family response regulator
MLTEREKQVLDAVAHGRTSKEIGKTLQISWRTVECYRGSLLRKFDARNTAEMIKKASDQLGALSSE